MRGSKRQVTGVFSAKDREMFGKAGYRILAVFILCQLESPEQFTSEAK
jgi:hypothetical protein